MSQSLASIKVHLVFSTKSRQPMLDSEIRGECFKYMATVAMNHGSKVYEIGGVEDHVHLLLTFPRTVTLSKLVEILKTSTSHWIKSKKESLRFFSWQTGYGAFSVSESQVPIVQKYIQEQPEHHRKGDFKTELLKMLRLSHMEFEEKHLWD